MRKRAFLLSLVALGVMIAPSTGHAEATTVAGVPASQVGVHGPKTDYTSGPLELFGHTDLTQTNTETNETKPLGNNGAVALIGDCAYVGRWHDYFGYPIQIVDVSDPSSPARVGSVPDSQIPGAVARELRAIDLPGFKMLAVLTFAYYTDQGATEPGYNAIHFFAFPSGDCRAPVHVGEYDLLSFRPHEFFQWLDPNPAHNVNGHPRVLEFITTPLNATDVVVVDASDPEHPALAGGFNAGQVLASYREKTGNTGVGTYGHSLSLTTDGTRALMSQWDGGFFSVDTSAFAAAQPAATAVPAGAQSVPLLDPPLDNGNTHSAVKIPGKNAAVIGHEIYVTTDGCPFGWMAIDSLGDATTPPSLLSEFRLAENNASNCDGIYTKSTNELGLKIDGSFSMHNQTVTPHYALASWYGGGLRVVDITVPSHPSETAFFVPKPVDDTLSIPQTSLPTWGKNATPDDDWRVATWSYPVLRRADDGTTYIYVTDIQSGLYILRATPGSALADELNAIAFDEGNSDLGAFVH